MPEELLGVRGLATRQVRHLIYSFRTPQHKGHPHPVQVSVLTIDTKPFFAETPPGKQRHGEGRLLVALCQQNVRSLFMYIPLGKGWPRALRACLESLMAAGASPHCRTG